MSIRIYRCMSIRSHGAQEERCVAPPRLLEAMKHIEAPCVARPSERHEWEYALKQHYAKLQSIQKQANSTIHRATQAKMLASS